MVQLAQIATANAAAFLLLVIVKLNMSRRFKGAMLLDVQILSLMTNITMFQCFFDTLVFWIDGRSFHGARTVNYAGNVIYYILNITIAYLWPLFVEYKLHANKEKLKRLVIILGIPWVAVILMVMSTPWHGFIFTVNNANQYVRTGYCFLIPTILIVIYLVYGTSMVYVHRKQEGKYMLFPVIYFITPISLGIIVQGLYYGISLIFIGIAIGLTGVYMSTQSESAYIDQLCGVYNRRYYGDYIRAFCNSGKKNDTITGVLLDMDDFKRINDDFGHDVGDKALMLFSSVLRRQMQDIGFVIRYGGDEFILLTKKPVEVLEDVLASIEQEIKQINISGQNEYVLAFSYGISTIHIDNNSDDFLKVMDTHMYEMKKAKKSKVC